MRPCLVTAALLGLLAAGGACGGAPGGELEPSGAAAAKPRVHKVVIKAFAFVPSDLTVSVGDTVVFTNEDWVPHTATTEPSVKDGFDSGELDTGKSWSYQADRPGELPYYCVFHPNMKARLTVK